MRHRDIHLLTVGRYTYTSDQRFRAIHHPHSEDWILQIKYPQHRDSGVYECQVSTTPHMSHFIHLNVIGKCPRKHILINFFYFIYVDSESFFCSQIYISCGKYIFSHLALLNMQKVINQEEMMRKFFFLFYFIKHLPTI